MVETWRSDSIFDPFEASGVARQELPAGALYVVATPIGNAADITVRALWVLAHVDAIAAEDTRTSKTLLARFGLRTPLLAAHEHNEQAMAARLVERLRAGARIALITDAGTPAVSDPGARIVRAVLDAGLRVIPIPGASSLLSAVSCSGLSDGQFRFVGFLPSGARTRERLLRDEAARGAAFVLFEAPHRIAATAAELAAALEPERRIVIARELTKQFESIAVVTAGTLCAHLAQSEARGEYVLVVDARAAAETDAASAEPLAEGTRRWLDALAQELPAARAAALAAKATGLPRERLYRELSQRGRSAGPDD